MELVNGIRVLILLASSAAVTAAGLVSACPFLQPYDVTLSTSDSFGGRPQSLSFRLLHALFTFPISALVSSQQIASSIEERDVCLCSLPVACLFWLTAARRPVSDDMFVNVSAPLLPREVSRQATSHEPRAGPEVPNV